MNDDMPQYGRLCLSACTGCRQFEQVLFGAIEEGLRLGPVWESLNPLMCDSI